MLSPGRDISEEKRALRREMVERREGLSDQDRQARIQAAAARLLALPELADVAGRTVAGYVATRGELDPAPALAGLAARGARVALPRVGGASPRLRFHRVDAGTAMRPGRFGILEPDERADEVAVADLDVVIAPGLAFDSRGRRVGYGGGYYDEALAAARAGKGTPVTVGFAFDFQVVDRCPAGEGDVAVDLVVTDARVVRP
jgi:5-formyltetrahydrofolate cyclo-ligase